VYGLSSLPVFDCTLYITRHQGNFDSRIFMTGVEVLNFPTLESESESHKDSFSLISSEVSI